MTRLPLPNRVLSMYGWQEVKFSPIFCSQGFVVFSRFHMSGYTRGALFDRDCLLFHPPQTLPLGRFHGDDDYESFHQRVC